MPPWRKVTRRSPDEWLVEFGSEDTHSTVIVRRFQLTGFLVKVKRGVGLYLDAWDENGQPVIAIHSLRHGED